MTPAANPDALSIALAAGGVCGSVLRAYITNSQQFISKKSLADVVVGFLVGFLYPLYPLIDFPANATTLQKAIMVAAIAYLAGDLLLNSLEKLAGLASKISAPLIPPPKSLVFALLIPALAGCAIPGSVTGMSAEQLREFAKIKDAAVTCVYGMYAGANVKAVFISADKGVPASITLKDNCDTTFSATQPSIRIVP